VSPIDHARCSQANSLGARFQVKRYALPMVQPCSFNMRTGAEIPSHRHSLRAADSTRDPAAVPAR
jgi:hypothetical protein